MKLSALLLAICIVGLVASAAPDTKNKRLRRRQAAVPPEEIHVMTGENATLECGDNMTDTYRRVWRRDYEVLTAANLTLTTDDRFTTGSHSQELTILNISLADAGEYTCVVYTLPMYKKLYQLTVRELSCRLPEAPVNGGVNVTDQIDRNDTNLLHYGDGIHYFCDPGYELIGSESRTCTDPYNGWSGNDPTCEPSWIASIRKRVVQLEQRISWAHSDTKSTERMELKITGLEQRLTSLETTKDFSQRNEDRLNGVDSTLHRIRTAINTNNHRIQWEKLLVGDVAKLGEKDGHVVSEFTWLVDDIDTKIQDHRAEKFRYLESSAFYTNIPGYRMKLHLYPDYDNSEHFGLYAVLIPGDFDSIIPWPFKSKFMLSIVSRDENVYVSDVLDPARVTVCNFGQPPPDNEIGCGFSKIMSHADLRSKEKLYKYQAGILVKITIYLDHT